MLATVNDVMLDPVQRTVRAEGRLIGLTPTEFSLLWFFARNPGEVYSRQSLIELINGEAYPATPRSVDVRLSCLRRKLGTLGTSIQTVRRQGYRLTPDNSVRWIFAGDSFRESDLRRESDVFESSDEEPGT